MNNLVGQVCNYVIFRNKDWPSDEFWVKDPRHSEKILLEMCHFYRRTRQKVNVQIYALLPNNV